MKQEFSNFEVMNFEDILLSHFTSMKLPDFLCKESGISLMWEYCILGIISSITISVLYLVCNPFSVSVLDLQDFIKDLANVDAVVINSKIFNIVKSLMVLVFFFFAIVIAFAISTPFISILFYRRMKKLGVDTPRFMFDWYASSTQIRTLWLKELYRLNIQKGYFTGNIGADISKITKALKYRKNSIAIKRISNPATYIYGFSLILGLGIGLGVLIFEKVIDHSETKLTGISVCLLLLFALMYLLFFLTRILDFFNAKRTSRKKKIDEICDNLNDLSWYLEMMLQDEKLVLGTKSHHFTSANSCAFTIKLRY